MTLDKLKVAARQHEQREHWRSAIDLYREAIRSVERNEDGVDPALYNRIGDLEHKDGEDLAAVEAWEQAATRYGEQGFFNNAIALCGKILRLDPGRIRTYLELARFQARKRVIYDVRQNLLVYRDQMTQRGQEEQATTELLRFERDFPSWIDLRLLLDQLLGREPEEAEVRVPGGEGGPDRGLVFLDTQKSEGLTIERASDPPPADSEGELVIEPTAVGLEVDAGGSPMEGLQPTSSDAGEPPEEVPEVSDMVEFERNAEEVGTPDAVAGLEGSGAAGAETAIAEDAITLEGLESTALDVPEIESTAEVSLDPPAATDGLIFIDVEAGEAPQGTPPAEAAAGDTTQVSIGEPADPLGSRAEGHDRLDEGDRSGAIAKLEEALAGYEAQEEWGKAWQVTTELIAADPRAIHRYQSRVELAVRLRDRERLASSYFDLGEALVAEGSTEKAVAVFRRLLEIDEHHAGGRAALRRMAPEARPEETDEGFVDFGAMVIDDVGPRSTRMRTETTTISDDEDETFREALAEFKRALDQNLSVEDHQTHYDLGLAFKEMGLLDEAIGEFQKALRSPEGRLRTSEALGQAFYDQGRPAVAEAVLRSVERGEEGDAEKIGVLYWLGRALEAQGKTRNALGYYERVLAVDVGFQDAGERITALGSKGTG